MSELNKPFETYRDYVPALFPGEHGTVSFGMFDPVELGKKGKPALREDGIVELRIKLAANSGRGENETALAAGSIRPSSSSRSRRRRASRSSRATS